MNGEMSVRVWYFLVLGMFATGGFWGAVWLAMAGLAQVRDWWRDRVTPLLEDDEPDWIAEWVNDAPLLPLPSEQTWDQMTSHQLPLEAGAADHFLRPPGYLPPDYLPASLERRAPWWEAEQRQAYAALGLEFPSGLVARVREAAQ